MRLRERQKILKKNRTKIEALRNLMASFAMTVGVVVVIVLQIPKSPEASIVDIEVFQHEIAYQVLVTDEEHALDLSSLRVVLENQFETYSIPIDLGLSSGFFENLEPNTTYQLQVFGSKGYGDERLASTYVKTQPNDGAAILSYELLESYDYFLNYQVQILVGDLTKYESIDFYYGVSYPDEPFENFTQVAITEENQTIVLEEIYNYHSTIRMYIEALPIGGTFEILDEVTFDAPILISSSLYLNRLDQDQADFTFYPDSYMTDHITYMARIKKGSQLVKEIILPKFEFNEDIHSHGTDFTVDQLKKNTIYQIELIATFINPQTLREESQLVTSSEFQTLGYYELIYEIDNGPDFIDVYIELTDPNHNFQIPYVGIYESGEFFEIPYVYQTYSFTPDGEIKYVNFEISYPDLETYHLVIGIKHETNHLINHQIVNEYIKP